MAVINYIYALPFYRNGTKAMAKVLGGWQISGVSQFQTGSPCGVGVWLLSARRLPDRIRAGIAAGLALLYPAPS